MALLHNPELRFVRPPTSPTGVDYFQADDLMIVLMLHRAGSASLESPSNTGREVITSDRDDTRFIDEPGSISPAS
jgi:hypothetical protein